jgi:uncharacterized protein YegP (UPF0339 family)
MRNTSNNDEGVGMAAKFEIRPVGVGTFSWVLLSQGRILATGEPYRRRATAEKAVESLRKAAAGATLSDLTVKAKAAPAKAAAKRAAGPGKAKASAATPAKAMRKARKVAKPASKAATKRASKATAAKPTGAARKRGAAAG